MIPLSIVLDGDGCWPDITPENFGTMAAIARLDNGMASGSTSVAVRILLPDGKVVAGQTSLKLLRLAVQAFEAAEEGR
jgi:hypothetical protein